MAQQLIQYAGDPLTPITEVVNELLCSGDTIPQVLAKLERKLQVGQFTPKPKVRIYDGF